MARAYQQINYLNNPKLKKSYVDISFTKEQVQEYSKCQNDPLYFLENYFKIITTDFGEVQFEPYDFQVHMLKTFINERFTICKMPRQVGKALDINTPILSENGWTVMGDIKVGDKIYGDDGNLTNVIKTTDIMFNHDCYEIEFDNNEKIIADKDHLWKVNTPDWRTGEKIVTTEKLIEIVNNKHKNGSGVRVKLTNALKFKEQNLSIDPYELGVWLGDGHSASARITCHKDDYMFYENKFDHVLNKSGNENIKLFRIKELHTKLNKSNILNNKHIPKDYIFSSYDQRLELIKGLMDTDGSCFTNGTCEFYQKNEKLIDDFIFILSSLGIKSRKRVKQIKGQNYYTVRFATSIEVFKLPRKLERQSFLKGHQKNKNLYIKSIQKKETVPVKCIEVDNKNKMFLCGKTLIPTHNSTIVISFLMWNVLFRPEQKIALLANKEKSATELLDRLKLAYEAIPLWMQQGILRWDATKLQFENKSFIHAMATGASAARSGSYNIVFLDEFAHVPGNIADDFYRAVYPTISSGKTTKMIVVSTPNGMNFYYKLWSDAEAGRNDFVPLSIHWSDHPDRDDKWAETEKKNIGEANFQQEYETEFLGGVNTLISASAIKEIVYHDPIESNNDLDIFVEPKPGHRYVATVDCAEGIGRDYSAISIIDVTEMPYDLVAKYRNNKISIIMLPNVIYSIAKKYNEAFLFIELEDIGSQVASTMYYDLDYENILMTQTQGRLGQQLTFGASGKTNLGVKMSQKVKMIGCANLKDLIENKKLIVHDFDVVKEFSNYEKRGKTFAAKEGETDDLVSSLVLFSWVVKQENFIEATLTNVQDNINKDEFSKYDLIPFQYHNSALENYDHEENGVTWHYVQPDSFIKF